MHFNREKHHRRSVRLKGYDYSSSGAYFVTICAWKRECLFGEINNGGMHFNDYGRIVKDEWCQTVHVRPNVDLDEFFIMPNHLHGIVVINRRGVLQYAPTREPALRSPSQTIGAIIRGFKSVTTKQINILRNTPGMPVWQRNYFEHIIRDEKDLYKIRQYIKSNPLQWQIDSENPDNLDQL